MRDKSGQQSSHTSSSLPLETAELQVSGMDCPSCAVAIESGLSGLPGVASVQVDLEAGRVLVRRRPDGADREELERSIRELGFAVGGVAGAGEAPGHRPLIAPPLVLAIIAVSLPLLVLFRDALPYMGGQNTLFTPGGLETETFGKVQLIAVGIAFVLGVAVFFSPSILAITSAVLGYAAGSPGRSRLDALRVASGFAVGLVAVNVVVGALFGGGGKVAIRFFGENLPAWNLLIAVALIAVGLILLRVWRPEIPWFATRTGDVRGFRGALLVSGPFGLIDCPACTPLLLPVALGAAATGNPLYGAALMGAYGLGRGVLLMGVGASAGAAVRARSLSRFLPYLEAAGGLVVLLAGLYFFKEFVRLASILGL